MVWEALENIAFFYIQILSTVHTYVQQHSERGVSSGPLLTYCTWTAPAVHSSRGDLAWLVLPVS